jgi:hypothetical protein
MAHFDLMQHVLVGQGGRLEVPPDDDVARKFLMLVEGECEGLGPLRAAAKFGYSKQRYFQLRALLHVRGVAGLLCQKRGPKTNYRRTPEAVRQVIRHRFLDPDASAEVIAQKLCQTGNALSIRSVERIIADYGLQKKTPSVPAASAGRAGQGPNHPKGGARRRQRSAQHRTRRSATPGRSHQ